MATSKAMQRAERWKGMVQSARAEKQAALDTTIRVAVGTVAGVGMGFVMQRYAKYAQVGTVPLPAVVGLAGTVAAIMTRNRQYRAMAEGLAISGGALYGADVGAAWAQQSASGEGAGR